MPKDLPNKSCRADTKKQNVVVSKGCKNSLIKVVPKVLASKIAKKKIATKTTPPKKIQQNEVTAEKLKDTKKKVNSVVPIKTRSGAVLDSNVAKTSPSVPKMKEKQKPAAEKPKPKETKPKAKKEPVKKASTVVNNTTITTTTPTSTTTKKETKKVKNDNKEEEPAVKKVPKNASKKETNDAADKKETIRNDKVDDIDGATPPVAKKDTKKDKEPVKKTPKAKKDDGEKKEALKQDKNDNKNISKKDIDETIKKEPATKKEPKSKEDASKLEKEPKLTKPEPAKKRPPKKPKEPVVNETAKKDTEDKIPPSNEPADKKEPPSQSNKIKFFKSKSKKAEKPKEPVSKKSNDLKDAFSVYDNIDELSEGTHNKTITKKKEPSKVKVSKIGKETELKMKQHLEEFKKTKLKAKDTSNKDDKRKLESDSEVDNKVCKKAKKNAGGDNDQVNEPSAASQQPSSKSKTNKKTKPKEEELSSPSSDSMPLNRLIAKTPTSSKKDSKSKTASSASAVKREPHSDDSEIETKKKPKTETPSKKGAKKSPAKASPAKKSVASDKKSEKTPKKSTPKKVVRFQKQATPKPAPKVIRKRKPRMASLNAMAMVHCLYDNECKSASVSSYDSTEYSDDNMIVEPVETKRKTEPSSVPETPKVENKETAVVKFEKEPMVVENQADPVINRESLRTAPGLRSIGKHWDMNSSSISSTLSDENLEVIASPIVIKEITSSLEKPKNILKKKFARALRRQVSEESSEEEKHQALLLEEKKRMVRRRRRQRKEITMDLKDMVVCKRMASLNATAILAASYSSLTGKRTITVKSPGKAEEKRENVENFEKTTESVMAKLKNRKLPFIRKKFSSSSDADVEDEADLSGGEVVVKTASSSGKQQVSLIVNQDSGVTITGVYLNSTTKSTHHQGYCSISGMQYRISSTSHTQTEATTVTTEPIVRNTQEPLRPPITVSLHPDRQSPPPPPHVGLNANHPSPVKTYTPLGALSNMQPPGSPHHMHHLHHHPKTVTISSTQEISSLERHGCPSAFSAPAVYGPPPPPPPPLPNVPTRPPYPILSKTPPEPGYVTGYYQPAGPLISHHHHHHHHHHHVQTNTSTTSTAALPASTATSTSSSASTISFAKVSQSPLVQPPTPPASNVTQPVSENSDNEMISATTPATEIAPSAEPPQEEPNFAPAYRFGSSANPPFRSPSHNYQSYYPSPPSTASLSHPQQQAHFQEILYSSQPPAGPPGPYHLSYLQPKGAPYHGPPPPFQRRYIPALPPQQYFHHEYSSSAPVSNAVQQQVVVPAHPLTSTAESYHSAPPTPSVVESYPPPPPPLYYSGYGSAPPTPYYPYAASSRSLTLVETSCPCPLQTCQKNGHTGPLTGIISKGPVKQHSTPLSPVALSLPKEPQDIRSLPSPARGSAGCRPTPSPAIATAKNPSCWSESTDCSYDTTGLLAISKTTCDEKNVDGVVRNGLKTPSRTELKKLKMKKFKSRKTSSSHNKHICKQDENMKSMADGFRMNGRPPFYTDVSENSDSVGLIAAASVTDYVSRVKPTIMEVCETDYCDENLLEVDEPKSKKYQNRKRRSIDDDPDKDMLKSYPVMRENVQKIIHPLEDGQIAVKKPKLDDELEKILIVEDQKPVDVEKNTYLSALQLCSVNDVDIEKIEEKDADLLKIAEDVAPLRKRDEEKSLKIQSKTTETVDQTTQRKDILVEESVSEIPDTKSTSDQVQCTDNVEPKKPPRLRRKRWTTKKKNKKKSSKSAKGSEEEKIEAENAEKIRRAELLSLTQKRASCKLKWSNGWTWLGEPFVSKIFLNTEGSEVLRTCYHAMKHQSGDIIKPKDCILLRSGSKKSDLPYVAKVAHLWEDPEDGEMMMSLFWFYRPEHTEHDSIHSESPYELYASKHKDINSVACIEDKCYVLTFNEYCRYHKSIRQTEESVDVSSVIVPPLSKKRYPRHSLLPPENTSLDLVFFCRKIYDFRQHRLLKNPFFV
ncbi:uncharacterized protein LOC135836989 isoform X2 [Planococcus citri]|uniref:uncharacterized protein LOC135836989 isoform X2 n=1 Tax=Planococcus citri TaxID=170843 RepID=UPI0031F913A4